MAEREATSSAKSFVRIICLWVIPGRIQQKLHKNSWLDLPVKKFSLKFATPLAVDDRRGTTLCIDIPGDGPCTTVIKVYQKANRAERTPMKKTMASAAVAMLVASGAASANTLDYLRDFNPRNDFNKNNFYLGLQAANADIDGVGLDGDDVTTLTGTLGFFFKWGISLEARFGVGSDQADSLFQDPVASYGAGMLRYHYTWNDNLMAYASAGAGIRLFSDVVEADSTVGIATAFGVNLFGTKKTALNVEYTYLGGGDASTSVGIGFHHYFGQY